MALQDIIKTCLEFSSDNKSMHETMTYILGHIITHTKCQYGFIGEIRYTDEATAYYRYHAMHGFPANSSYTKAFEKNKYIDFIQPDTLHSKLLETNDIVVCHDIPAHRGGKAMPDGHPPMGNFIILPLRFKGKISGAIGLSGAGVDFNKDWIESMGSIVNITEHMLNITMEKRIIEDHKIRFLVNVSHELRVPLNGIVCTTDMLKNTIMDKEQVELLDMVTHCNIQLLDIVNDILDYTKMSLGKLTLNMAPLSLRKCILSIARALESRISSKGLVLNVHYDSTVNMVIGDETRITQIILNLLNNAIKFTKQGSIDIVVKDDAIGDTECTLLFQIKDTGVGISPNKLLYIFDSFNQIANHLCSDCGTGLGLPITKYLVQMFNGSIWAESTVDKGTTMNFLMKFKRFTQSTDKLLLKQYFSGKYILVIADHQLDKERIYDTLKEYDFKTIMATTKDMRMYMGGVFTFEAMIICLDTALNKIPNMCPKYTLSPHQADEQGVTHILNDLYTTSIARSSSPPILDYNKRQSKSTINILIAVRDQDHQRVLSGLLNELEYYNIVVANDGFECYMSLIKDDYDIAFIDPILPVMDGLALVKKFKEKSNKSVILIAIVAAVSETIRTDCYAAGMVGYISIPIDKADLDVAMNKVLRKKVLTIVDGHP